MKWIYPNREIDPTAWGWELKSDQLFPKKISSNDQLIPEDILEFMSCSCRTSSECLKNCGCARNGLKCSEYCKNCFGKNCKNSEHIQITEQFLEEEDVSLDENLQNEDEFDETDTESIIQDLVIDDFLSLELEEESETETVNNTDASDDEVPAKKQRLE